MAKRESNFRNMVLTLFVVTLVASTSLALVYEVTKEPIRLAALERKNNAIMQVVPEFNNMPNEEEYTVEVNGDELVFYPARMDGELVGVAVETFTHRGYSGTIRLMVGLLPDGTIQGIEVLRHAETPGLGDKIETDKSDFYKQFVGRNPGEFIMKVRQDNGEIDGITASTITSRAYCDAVQLAYDVFIEEKGDIK